MAMVLIGIVEWSVVVPCSTRRSPRGRQHRACSREAKDFAPGRWCEGALSHPAAPHTPSFISGTNTFVATYFHCLRLRLGIKSSRNTSNEVSRPSMQVVARASSSRACLWFRCMRWLAQPNARSLCAISRSRTPYASLENSRLRRSVEQFRDYSDSTRKADAIQHNIRHPGTQHGIEFMPTCSNPAACSYCSECDCGHHCRQPDGSGDRRVGANPYSNWQRICTGLDGAMEWQHPSNDLRESRAADSRDCQTGFGCGRNGRDYGAQSVLGLCRLQPGCFQCATGSGTVVAYDRAGHERPNVVRESFRR